MTPVRPLGGDAKAEPVEMPEGVSRTVEPSSPLLPAAGQLYAALDLGTNSCRMLIAQPKGSQFLDVDSFSKTVQLGAGLEASGRLSRASMGRTVQALRICQKKIEKHNVRRMRLVATEACRRARNARDFFRRNDLQRQPGFAFDLTDEILGIAGLTASLGRHQTHPADIMGLQFFLTNPQRLNRPPHRGTVQPARRL